MHRFEQRRMPRDAVRGPAQRLLDSARVPVRQQPLLIAHVRPYRAQAVRQKVNMLIERPMHARYERVERFVRVRLEIAGEEMIQEDVGDDARPVPVLRNQHAAECGDGRMGIGECIDPAMLDDTLTDPGRESIVQRPFDEIAREVPDQPLGSGGVGQALSLSRGFRGRQAESLSYTSQEEVGEIVHWGAMTVTCCVSLFVTETKAQISAPSTSTPTLGYAASCGKVSRKELICANGG